MSKRKRAPAPLVGKTASDASSERGSITTAPWLDAVCIGGASILIIGWMLASGYQFSDQTWAAFWFLQVALNYPHFVASYRLLYQSKTMVMRYKWVSIYAPALMLGYVIFVVVYAAVKGEQANSVYRWITEYVASMYLAIHYTGQAWGMTATFGYIGKVQFVTWERRVLRWTLWVFMAWHICLYHTHFWPPKLFVPGLLPYVPYALRVVDTMSHAGMLLCIVTFIAIGLRLGRFPPLRMLIPIPALYLGYVLFRERGHSALFVMQLAHSVQYLIFPARIEVNRMQADRSRGALVVHMLVYSVLLIIGGWLLFPGTAKIPGFPATYGSVVLIAMVNVHHYLTDGAVWKISTPEVRKDLFRHLQADPPRNARDAA